MTTKVTIISGFLGAGKTTLIRKLLQEVYANEQVVLVENEFGEIGIDGGFLQDAGIEITEMNSGCICCSLSGDFRKALSQVQEQFHPDRILIEPSGVGKLSDVKRAVSTLADSKLELGCCCTVADVHKCAMYQRNFGEFFNDQIEHADALILSRTQQADTKRLQESVDLLHRLNPDAPIVTTPWKELEGAVLAQAMEHHSDLREELLQEEQVCPVCGHIHAVQEPHDGHHHERAHPRAHDQEHAHKEEHGAARPHAHGHEHPADHVHEHPHAHPEHDHHHDHHHGHHHHHADEVFTSWGQETIRRYSRSELETIVHALAEDTSLGQVLRAKGMVQGEDAWYYFDVTPHEYELREGKPSYTGRYCVIGAGLQEERLQKLFAGAK